MAYVAYRSVRPLAQLVRYGSGGLRYGRFPFFLGETLDVSFERTGRMGELRELTATLRCVEERYEMRGRGEDRSPVVVGYEAHRETKHVRVPAGAQKALGVGLSFALPGDAPPTLLGERPPVYWELEVRAEAPGVDYGAAFLVPVYAR